MTEETFEQDSAEAIKRIHNGFKNLVIKHDLIVNLTDIDTYSTDDLISICLETVRKGKEEMEREYGAALLAALEEYERKIADKLK